ncbi:MAG TPA: hypothetical protein PKA82_07000 [Pyrinomonadaceae bacterium]|nr:hypothetical protein [Pyrinomonadaceae bacterium]
MGHRRAIKIRSTDKPIVYGAREAASATDVAGSKSESTCLEFWIEDPTQLVDQLRENDEIFCDFAEPRMRVHSALGVLGLVPEIEAFRLNLFDGMSLTGQVLKVELPRRAYVEVCP